MFWQWHRCSREGRKVNHHEHRDMYVSLVVPFFRDPSHQCIPYRSSGNQLWLKPGAGRLRNEQSPRRMRVGETLLLVAAVAIYGGHAFTGGVLNRRSETVPSTGTPVSSQSTLGCNQWPNLWGHWALISWPILEAILGICGCGELKKVVRTCFILWGTSNHLKSLEWNLALLVVSFTKFPVNWIQYIMYIFNWLM
jgi:hypothetical protein